MQKRKHFQRTRDVTWYHPTTQGFRPRQRRRLDRTTGRRPSLTRQASRSRERLTSTLVIVACITVVLLALYHGAMVPADRLVCGLCMVVVLPAYLIAVRSLERL